MPGATIDQLIINSPYEEPTEYWSYVREMRSFRRKPGRRLAGYVTATPGAKSFDDPGIFRELPLVNQIRDRVKDWRNAGYPGITGVTKPADTGHSGSFSKLRAKSMSKMKPSWKGSRPALLAQVIRLVEGFVGNGNIRIVPPLFNQEDLRRRLIITLNMTKVVGRTSVSTRSVLVGARHAVPSLFQIRICVKADRIFRILGPSSGILHNITPDFLQ